MEGIVYHGSKNGNITILEPRVSTHLKPCVYATDDRCVALLFMGKSHGDLDTKIGNENNELILVERRPGILDLRYNQSGYLYELDGRTFEHYDFLWSKEVISFEPVKIERKIEIPNILDAINEEEKKGNIKIYRYPDRPKDMPLDNSDLIEKYIKYEEQGVIGAINNLLEIYPEFKDRVKYKYHLNK